MQEPITEGVSTARLAILLAMLLAVSFQGTRGLFDSTEGRYAECAREMLAAGNLFDPVLEGQPHWSKPPLTYMAIAAGLETLGNNAWGARAYLAISYLLTVAAVFLLGKSLCSIEAGGYAALIFATSPIVVGAANSVSADMLLTCFEACAMCMYWLGVRRSHARYVALMWLALGLAVVTKGPVGLMPLLGIVPTQHLLRKRGAGVPRLFNPAGLLLFLVVGFGWYAWEIVRHRELVQYWIFEETLNRVASTEAHRNAQFWKPFTIYLPILVFGTGAWGFMLATHFRRIPWPKHRWFRWSTWDDGGIWLFLMAAFWFPLLIFAVSQSRLPLYILPLFVPAAVTMGIGIEWLRKQHGLRKRPITVIALISAVFLIAAKGAYANVPSHRNMLALSEKIAPVLEEYSGYELYLIQQESLYGLDFYLQRVIPVIRLEKAVTREVQSELTSAKSLILLRTRYVNSYQSLVEEHRLHQVYRDDYWSILATGKPIT